MFTTSTASATDGTEAVTKSATSKAKLDEDLNRFLNLLVTQLKNQDPLDPMDANEFTSQLVQFASVEQQIYQNANLEKLLNVQQTSQVATMVDFIGRTVESVGQEFPLENGAAKFTYDLENNAHVSTITIQNADGKTVYSADAETGSGKHEFEWDGKNNFATQQPDGSYTVTVTALDREGALQDVLHTVFGRVTGAGAENGKVSLYMGTVVTGLDKVLAVNETKPAP